jgi:hypothetical protein
MPSGTSPGRGHGPLYPKLKASFRICWPGPLPAAPAPAGNSLIEGGMLNTPQRVKFAVTLNSNHAVATSARRSSTTAVAIHCPRQFQEGFSQDGNAISTALGHYTIPLRSIDRDAGRGAAAQRFQISFQGFAELMARTRQAWARAHPLCLSWLATAFRSEELARRKPARPSLWNIVELSTQLREGQITRPKQSCANPEGTYTRRIRRTEGSRTQRVRDLDGLLLLYTPDVLVVSTGQAIGFHNA